MLKKLTHGGIAVIIAMLAVFALTVSATPAQAWDPNSTGNTPPPRINPPAGTTVPHINKPLTTPAIPRAVFGTALKVFGYAGIGYMIGTTYRQMSCAGG